MREELLSVGIDIGTSTTSLVFSKLVVENTASNFTVPRISIVDKEIIYRSNIYFTPLLSNNTIDAQRVKEIVEYEYKKAGIKKEDINTGAVIITGETARKENANEVLHSLSGFAGDFVVATAGPDLESIISAKGAGAQSYSKEHSTSVVNLDIGGGTTNLALFVRGDLMDTGCLDIGGRLVKMDSNNKIIYIAPKIEKLIKEKSIDLNLGDTATVNKLRPVVKEMVELIKETLFLKDKDKLLDMIVTNKTIKNYGNISCVSFSGGVADYIYNEEEIDDYFKYNDIGILLGNEIKNSDIFQNLKLIKSEETIRATVVGAGSHTTDISGSTITYTEENFPIKNLPVLKLTKEEEAKNILSKSVKDKLNWFKLENDLQNVAIAIEGKKNPSFIEINETAKELVDGMLDLIDKKVPLVIIVENDMAKALGQSICALLNYKKNIICIDNINVDNGDYIDIGKPIANGKVLPVVIKTLVFTK